LYHFGVAFERKVLRRMFGGIKVNENGRVRYNKDVMQLFGDLDTLSFMRISRIGHVSRMESKRKVSQVSNSNPQGNELRERPTTDGGTAYRQILINSKL
jgi:hypothetical protein